MYSTIVAKSYQNEESVYFNNLSAWIMDAVRVIVAGTYKAYIMSLSETAIARG